MYISKCVLLIAILLGFSSDSFAYLDPASGSMLFTAIFGMLVTVLYFLKGFYYKLVNVFISLFSDQVAERKKYEIVFFSEGKQYWNTFKPVIEALDSQDVKSIYFTMGEDDAGLKYQSHNVETRYIGIGNRAYAFMNRLEADICVMTTPGLDVLHIRRSPGVKHYAHLVHAPTSGTYKLYAFDYFDSVLCSGQHQIDEIKELEALRATQPKLLLRTGCPYMDVLAQKLMNASDRPTTQRQEVENTTILIAPSWGKNALLNRFGADLIRPLLAMGYEIIIRPHPQSYIEESTLLKTVKTELGEHQNLNWDDAADGFQSLYYSDIMVSDLSGVVFDYAFIFEKPVITIKFELDLRGLDANDLKGDLWELGMLDKVGKCIDVDEIASLPKLVADLLSDDDRAEKLKVLREHHLYNFRVSGEVAAEQLLNIHTNLQIQD